MKDLNLSDSQRQQLKTIRDSSRRQLKTLGSNEAITLKEFRAQKAQLQKSERDQIESLLTPEQKSHLAKLQAARVQHRERLVAQGLDSLKVKLNLTDEQVNKIRAAHEVSRAKAKLIQENTRLSHFDKKQQLTELHKEQKESLKQVLTPEQVGRMEQISKERITGTPENEHE